MRSTPAGWEGLLSPDERIIWQGRPSPRISLAGMEPSRTLFGLAFMSFAVFWTVMAASSIGDSPGPFQFVFPLFGLPFIFTGAKLAGGDRLWQAFVRKYSWYTLSNQRAFIATEMFGKRSLKSWPINSESVLDFTEGAASSVFFADREGRTRRRGSGGSPRIGFEFIEDGREVMDLMRQVQRGTI